jgi:hypothetical protein
MSYQNLYSMPCRLPCNRYTGYGDLFEAAANNPASPQNPNLIPNPVAPKVGSKEGYGYEPTVENYQAGGPVALKLRSTDVRKRMNIKNKNKNHNMNMCNCHCQPNVVVRESYDYDPNVFQESYEYEPNVNREGFQEAADCGCSMSNPPYRMENCGYNQSPSWVTQNMFKEQPAESVAQMIASPQQVRQMARPQAVPRQVSAGEPDCGCGKDNPPYRMENCGYNESPTWVDQASFRQNYQNKY